MSSSRSPDDLAASIAALAVLKFELRAAPEHVEDEVRAFMCIKQATEQDLAAAMTLISTWTTTRANPASSMDHEHGRSIAGRLLQLNARLAARDLLARLLHGGQAPG